jgi:hypothetical protein
MPLASACGIFLFKRQAPWSVKPIEQIKVVGT